jgi:hypothetical protein
MRKYNQSGGIALILLVVVLIAVVIGAGGFAASQYQQNQDYKTKFDQKVKEEVAKAEAAQQTKLNQEFAEREKSPNKTFKGPATYGSIQFKYPKTWSAYVEQSNQATPINGYFFPDVVPSTQRNSQTPTAFALRLELVDTDYDQIIKQMNAQISQGKLKAAAYVPPKMKGKADVQTGVRFDGQIEQNLTGSMVVIKVRDKTLKIYTESTDYMSDFNDIVLKNLTFSP